MKMAPTLAFFPQETGMKVIMEVIFFKENYIIKTQQRHSGKEEIAHAH